MLLDVGHVHPLNRLHESEIVIRGSLNELEAKKRTYISSNVGVTYLMRVMSMKGTWRTDLDMNSRPLRSLSSHRAFSRLTTHDNVQMENLTLKIWYESQPPL